MLDALRNHWQEYLIEAWCLGMFMISACAFGVAIFHPESPISAIHAVVRMIMMGVAMGATAIFIICSPWGKRSGAHFNPAVTLTFLRLGKINREDACFYIFAQAIGGTVGVMIAYFFLGDLLADSSVNFVITIPGGHGDGVAFAAEVIISFIMMTMILFTSNSRRFSRYTPLFAGSLVAIFIAVESPISGMSMNPARTAASALVSGNWTSTWIYFLAPPIAMLTAAELYVRTKGIKKVLCAKLDHFGPARCIFHCDFGMES